MHRHSKSLDPTPASVEEKWRRKLPYRIYDYNYKVGESYYNPQTEYIDDRDNLCKKSDPPECASFAERFAARPFYGKAYGLPYNEYDAALYQPLAHPRRRSSSASRGSRNEPEYEPLSSRTGRGRDRTPRDRRLSFGFDDDEDFAAPPPRRRFSLADELDFKTPVSRYIDADFGFRSSAGKEGATNDKVIPSVLSDEIKNDIKKLEKKFRKAETLDRGVGGKRSQSWTEVVYNDALDAPGKRTVKKENVAFTDPKTGTNVRKSSYQQSTRVESSKPPRAPPRPMRLLSLEDSTADVKPRTRRRHVSLSDDDFDVSKIFSRSSLKSESGSDDNKFGSSRKMMSQRRAKESEELTSNINMMLDRMRKHSLGELDNYPLKSSRAAIDNDVPRRTRSVRSRMTAYGYSK